MINRVGFYNLSIQIVDDKKTLVKLFRDPRRVTDDGLAIGRLEVE